MLWKRTLDRNIKSVELRSSPVIIRVNNFDEKSAKEFAEDIAKAHNTGQSIIPVIIDSYGGQVYSLMSMVASIKNSELPVATIVEGKAMSCGVVLFSCGTEGYRYITEDATLMIHDVSSMAWGKNSEIQASAEEVKRLNDKIYRILSTNSNKSEKWFNKQLNDKGRADWFIESTEAIDLGLADKVGMPKLEINVKLDINLREIT
jgi:ATP-dependent Clp protease protease subunit|tara:strand:- start:39 stop:650 length:612 start_codon:yes stop_codon:yes gene_type:complete